MKVPVRPTRCARWAKCGVAAGEDELRGWSLDSSYQAFHLFLNLFQPLASNLYSHEHHLHHVVASDQAVFPLAFAHRWLARSTIAFFARAWLRTWFSFCEGRA